MSKRKEKLVVAVATPKKTEADIIRSEIREAIKGAHEAAMQTAMDTYVKPYDASIGEYAKYIEACHKIYEITKDGLSRLPTPER